MTDYTKLEGADLLHAMGDDAAKWAAAFCQHYAKKPMDEETVMAWFTNAIEHSHDKRMGRIHNGEHAEYMMNNDIKGGNAA